MNDPHVESVEYELKTDDTLRFDNPDPLEGDAGSFTYRLADGILTVTMKDHYATEEEARAAVYQFVRAWELDYALEHGRRALWFTFKRPNIIDRKPIPGAPVLLAGTATLTLTAAGNLTATHRSRSYPKPPAAFDVSPDVDTLWTRYENQLLGREGLPSMGYFCLTVFETLYGATPRSGAVQRRKTTTKRKSTALALNVELAVLEKLGELTTERGDEMTARKVEAGTPFQQLTAKEAVWIQAALRGIMRRLGMKKAGAVIPPLTMADLPVL